MADYNNRIKCPICGIGDVTVVYSGPKYVEFYVAEVDTDGSVYTSEMYDLDLDSSENSYHCTDGCRIETFDDLMGIVND